LDELPQFVNVLLGHMSIVGPRPEIPEITDLYNSKQAKRLIVKPGLTGLAQINGRANLSHGKKMEFDLVYVKKRSMLLDLKIVGITIMSVLSSRGAY
jgi:lipopolysaccharide/colanic/teichoic acid biosynthesis glycosyltransferase